MSAAHLHLLLNHAPLFGLVFALLGLAWAFGCRNESVGRAALGLLVLSGMLVLPVYLSGENAEDLVEGTVGVSASAIEAHEEAALGAAIATGVVGIVALVALLGFRKRTLPRWVSAFALVLALVASGWIGYVANLGGQINHPEIRSGTTANGLAPSASPRDHDDD